MDTMQLKLIRKRLPRGGQKQISEKLHLKYNVVRDVLHGKCRRIDVIDEALNIIDEHLNSERAEALRIKKRMASWK